MTDLILSKALRHELSRMDCFYINLDRAMDRRAELEANFNAAKTGGWSLTRFPAIDAVSVSRLDVKGAAKPSEKACFLSHRSLISQNIGADKPILILEDDAQFGAMSCRAIDSVVGSIAPDDWDVLFTDADIASVGAWPDFIRLHRNFLQTGQLKLVDLSQIQFAAATAYIVNNRSIEKLSALLNSISSIDIGYDLYLRNLIYSSLIKSFVVAPFPTTVSAFAEVSNIDHSDQASPANILTLFRRMTWIERDLSRQSGEIERLRGRFSTSESGMFAALFEAMIA